MRHLRFAVFLALALIAGCERESDRPTERVANAAPRGDLDLQLAAFKTKVVMYPPLQKYIESVLPGMDAIPDERKQELKKTALFIKSKRQSQETAQLLFICTHNSRRSHMGQIWATTAAAYYGIDKIKAYSGGTEATAFNPRAVGALERAGFKIENPGGENPHYKVSFSESQPTLECFSKKFGDPPNPQSNFAAIMTCAQADKNCPVVAGATLRIPLHYEDPKASDGSPEETATYDARARQIATEMFYLFSIVKG